MRLTEALNPRRAARQVCKLLKNEAPRMMNDDDVLLVLPPLPEKVKKFEKTVQTLPFTETNKYLF